MKFVYFGYDFMLSAVERLLADGHELSAVCSFPCDNRFNFNTQTLALAQRLGIPATLERPLPSDIARWCDDGVQVFLAMGYPYKIPPIDESRAFGMNVHPSLLPKGRGLMPTPTILLDHPEAGGLTAHKLTQQYDDGDILAQIALPVSERETAESYSLRTAMAAPDLVAGLFADLPTAWQEARKQDESAASTFPAPDSQMRLLHWDLPLHRLDAIARAFGRYGSLAFLDDTLFVVYAHDAWPQVHDYAPGTIVLRQHREIVVAAKGGFIALKDIHPAQAPGES